MNYKAGNPTKPEKEKYISLNDYEKLKAYLKTINSRSALALFIMICTGCRISGVRYMKLEYINQLKNQIYINEHKTDTSPRYVSVAKSDMKHILDMINNLIISYDGYIFKDTGSIITVNAINKTLKKACEVNKIPIITSHAIRHTHCSYLLEEKYSEEETKTTNILEKM